MTRESILSAIETIARLPNGEDGEVVAELMRGGLSEADAEFAVAFVPLAFGRATMLRMPSCAGLRLPDEAEIPGESGSEWVHLACVPHFSIARELAEEAFTSGILGTEEFMAVSLRSAEMQAVNLALNKGQELNGGAMSPPLMLRLGDFKKNRVQSGATAERPSLLRRLLGNRRTNTGRG